MANLLNLKKGDLLNLTKAEPGISKLKICGGWDPVKPKGLLGFLFGGAQKDYDLDLVAYLHDDNGKIFDTVYFGNRIHDGIYLDKDNLTGKDDPFLTDDETIFIEVGKLDSRCKYITFGIIIYNGVYNNQSFNEIQNAYIRVCDESNKEICRYNLTNESKIDNTACIAGILTRQDNEEVTFTAAGKFVRTKNIDSLKGFAVESIDLF